MIKTKIDYKLPFILITSMFFMWGLANNMTDTLLAAFKKIMSMSDFQTSWIQVAFYGSYFCLALPAALVTRKFDYKTGVLIGLGMFIGGALLFYPASQTMVYGHFLVALFVLAGGLSILETSANPYIIRMGPPETGIQRLNLAQSFNPIGSITGVLLSKFFILSQLDQASEEERAALSPAQLESIQQAELSAVMGPYIGTALLLFMIWLMIYFTRMPKGSDRAERDSLRTIFTRLFKNINYKWGVVAQFFYVGAQIGVWSFTIRYVMKELGLDESDAATYYLASLVLFTASRFVCTALLNYIRAEKLLALCALGAIVCCLVVVVFSGFTGVIALVLISGFMSLMFPTIFGLTITGLGDDTKIGGSGLIMAILGGAVLTAVQGTVSDITSSIKLAFLVPAMCFLVIFIYGLKSMSLSAKPTK
ncbi:MAG: L-fucose:H+ symporter permease [Cytophagales bacterium]|nr:L-fucose:H+ symporter permease [Cytophagales bacterium]